jgi:hypothetical protein
MNDMEKENWMKHNNIQVSNEVYKRLLLFVEQHPQKDWNMTFEFLLNCYYAAYPQSGDGMSAAAHYRSEKIAKYIAYFASQSNTK